MEYQSSSVSAGRQKRPRRRRLVMVVGLAVGAVLASAVAANAAEGPKGMRSIKSWTSLNHFDSGGHRPFHPTAPSLLATQLAFQTVDDRADPTFNQMLGINDGGRMVGYFGSGADAAHPNKGFQAWLTNRGPRFINENFPHSAQTQVVGINDAGTSVGFFVDAKGNNFGFVDRDGHFRAVSNPETPANMRFNQLLGINNHDIAVGFFNDKAGNSHGYLFWTRTGQFRMVRLPVKAESVVVTGINDRGDLSGFYTVNKVTHGFVFLAGHFLTLDLGNHMNTQALGINNADLVVGSFVDAAGKTHGYVWRPGGFRQIDHPWAAGAEGTVINGLNNRNQIVGFYMDKAGKTHGFVARATNVPAQPMTPLPMPTMTTSPMAPVPSGSAPPAPAPGGSAPVVQGTHF
jgi:hypothetical protein